MGGPPLIAGTYVNLHLTDPIERLWGRIQSLDATGVTLRGFSVRDVETFKYQFKCEDKSVYPQTSFYPMRRVLKIDLDEPIGSVPSVVEAIVAVTGSTPEEIIALQ